MTKYGRMLEPSIAQLLEEDQRYPLEAYIFIFEALHYAQNVLELGADSPGEPLPPSADEEEREVQHHVTGQQLCEAVRQFALEQYGYMAKLVLNNWGLRSTGDFGEIVFNLIRIGKMRKTPQDRREDFDDVYEFDDALLQRFRIELPKAE
jgi:uncharacterized repeat protein (TIGR04138 family)